MDADAVQQVRIEASRRPTEAEAKELGRKIRVRVNDMSDWLSSRTYNEPSAWAKVIIDETPIASSALISWAMAAKS